MAGGNRCGDSELVAGRQVIDTDGVEYQPGKQERRAAHGMIKCWKRCDNRHDQPVSTRNKE